MEVGRRKGENPFHQKQRGVVDVPLTIESKVVGSRPGPWMVRSDNRPLAIDEVKAIFRLAERWLDDPDPYNRRRALLAYVALHIPLRRSELRLLRWEDFDFQAGTVVVHRHKKQGPGYQKGVPMSGVIMQTLPMPKGLRLLLQPYAGKGPLFVSQRRLAACCETLLRDWMVLLKKAAVRYCPLHSARNTVATIIAAHPLGSVYHVQTILGHKDVATSQLYVKHNPELSRPLLDELYGATAQPNNNFSSRRFWLTRRSRYLRARLVRGLKGRK